jgi:hypothetical protein
VKQKQNQTVGFSAHAENNFKPERSSVIKFPNIASNFGGHFDVKTGEFTAPLNGMYAVSLYFKINGIGVIKFSVRKLPCGCNDGNAWCNKCEVWELCREKNSDNHVSAFFGVNIKAGERLFIKCMFIDNYVDCLHPAIFSCFKVN